MEQEERLPEDINKSIDGIKEDFERFKDYIDQAQKKFLPQIKHGERPFEMLNLPSGGLFYPNKASYILLGYLTYFEENLLTSEMLVDSGIAYEIAFGNLIYNSDLTIDQMLTGDVQAMSLALRSFSYGNNIEIDLKCSHCDKTSKESIPLSSFKMKQASGIPDDCGEIAVAIGRNNTIIKIKPVTFKRELEYLNNKNRQPLEDLTMFIVEFDGVRDVEMISRRVRSLRLLESRELRSAIANNVPGVDTKYNYECVYCDKETMFDFGGNAMALMKLPSSYRNNVLEELFLLCYYGKSITLDDAKKMPVTERRWLINRIQEEIEKQREAERKEMAKAKSKSKSRR